jgi:hypothetical protein
MEEPEFVRSIVGIREDFAKDIKASLQPGYGHTGFMLLLKYTVEIPSYYPAQGRSARRYMAARVITSDVNAGATTTRTDYW